MCDFYANENLQDQNTYFENENIRRDVCSVFICRSATDHEVHSLPASHVRTSASSFPWKQQYLYVPYLN